ncbi:CoA-acylating methylmalonate-semialdehyde dehydrogenase [Celerinatantimonas yamalensis]|uniref:methylmalonate-semialdehyde dehydrogenase (CoA acylating) n=1 Tax=Celerinatantimonas yamalensis TaxID=559956 RepID=A0ABW9G6R8_9GAMM
MTTQLQNFINGSYQASSSGRTAMIDNPATGDILAEVDLSCAAEIPPIVNDALTAQRHWASLAPLQRAQILRRFAKHIDHHQDELAQLICLEQGKTYAEAQAELTQGIATVEFASQLPEQIVTGDHLTHPVGVCVGITPFSYPALMPLWLFPIALGCGNSFILKPSERTPSVALRLAELLHQAGLPEGVLQIVLGDKEAVDALITDPNVNAVSFIGSSRVAEAVYHKASSTGKRVQAFGSAKNHLLVAPDADLHQVSNALIPAAFAMAGEHCMAISVVVVVGEQRADELVGELAAKAQSLKVGSGLAQPANELGPLISEAHRLKVRGDIEQGEKDGATLVVDGRELNSETGYFLGASLFDHVTPTMRLYRHEILGPVLAIVRVASIEEGVALINSHPLAQFSAIFSRDETLIEQFVQQVNIGLIGINQAQPNLMPGQSISGWRQTGFGPLGLGGDDAIRFFTQVKTLCREPLSL